MTTPPLELTEIATRSAVMVAVGGPAVSAIVKALIIPKKWARRAALLLGIIAAGLASRYMGSVWARAALEAFIIGPMIGGTAMGTYEGVRAVHKKVTSGR